MQKNDLYGDGLVFDDRSPKSRLLKQEIIPTEYGSNGLDTDREPFSAEEEELANTIGLTPTATTVRPTP